MTYGGIRLMGRTWLMLTLAAGSCAVVATPAASDEWPQWRGPNRDGVWSETGIVQAFETPQIPVKWRVPIGSGYSGPTVADGRVYVTDRLLEPREVERVHCFDWQTGTRIWSHSYDCGYGGVGYQAGPRAAVTVDEGRAYSLGTVGNLYCFDAARGNVIWQADLRTKYRIRMPKWGISAAPLVDGDLLILHIGGENACVVALDKRTGDTQWTALNDDASYAAPIMIDQAGRRVLLCWTGDRVNGLDPATGEKHWSFDFEWERWPIGIATPVFADNRLLVSDAHKGTLLLRLTQDELGVEQVWHRRKETVPGDAALHCLISTPYIADGHIYGVDGRGTLRCLRLDTGEQVWMDQSAVPANRWATIHLIRHHDNTWLFNERGELIIARLTPRGYDEISRAKLIEPTMDQLRRRGGVTWSHPAFAYRHIFARNDQELVCADLSAK